MANCQPGRYYLLNNYNAGYNVDGTVNTSPFTVPPQKTDYVTIGNELSAHHISWGYFGEDYNNGHPELRLLPHLRPDAVLDIDHDEPLAA